MQLGFIGAGNMAWALAHGLGVQPLVSDVDASRARALADALGGQALGSNAEVADAADAVVLCHKPKQLDEVAAEIGGRAKAVISILAGVSTAALEERYGDAPVYRFIPNIPAEVGRGVLCYAAGRRAQEGPESEVLETFARAGTVVPLDEPLIEPAMAIMSCGPAFLALVAEALAEAGTAHGLERSDAARMAVETMAGTAAYLLEHDLDTAALRQRVATPGGVTEKGLRRLEEGGVPDAFRGAVDTVVEATS